MVACFGVSWGFEICVAITDLRMSLATRLVSSQGADRVAAGSSYARDYTGNGPYTHHQRDLLWFHLPRGLRSPAKGLAAACARRAAGDATTTAPSPPALRRMGPAARWCSTQTLPACWVGNSSTLRKRIITLVANACSRKALYTCGLGARSTLRPLFKFARAGEQESGAPGKFGGTPLACFALSM